MHIFLVVVALLAAILLVGAVLLQSPKAGSGLTGGMASLGTVQTLGVRRTSDFLTKTTAILAGLVMIICFIAQFTLPSRENRNAAKGSILQKEVPSSMPGKSAPSGLPVKDLQTLPGNPAPLVPAK
jgi:preprotein translocase subunit SecG